MGAAASAKRAIYETREASVEDLAIACAELSSKQKEALREAVRSAQVRPNQNFEITKYRTELFLLGSELLRFQRRHRRD